MKRTIKWSPNQPLNHGREKPFPRWLEPENQRYNLNQKLSAKQSYDSNQSEATSGTGNLDTDDIMKYIQNAEETEDDVNFFFMIFSWFIIHTKVWGMLLSESFLHVLVFTKSAIRLC